MGLGRVLDAVDHDGETRGPHTAAWSRGFIRECLSQATQIFAEQPYGFVILPPPVENVRALAVTGEYIGAKSAAADSNVADRTAADGNQAETAAAHRHQTNRAATRRYYAKGPAAKSHASNCQAAEACKPVPGGRSCD